MAVDVWTFHLTGETQVTRSLWMSAESFQAPGTKPAALVEYGIGYSWEFTDGTDDTLFARFPLPYDMDRSVAPVVKIGWSTPTASAGNCRWQIECLYRAQNEAMDAAADETLVDNFAASGTAKGLIVSSQTLSSAPSSTDVCLSLRIKRRADDENDTLGEDNHLHGVCFEYTANKLGTAT